MKPWLIVLKVVVSAALIGWVVAKADWPAIGAALELASPTLLAGALAAHVLSYLLLNLRWWLLLTHLIPALRLRDTVAAFWLGLFGNNLLPSGMGGDVFRIVRLRSETVSGRSLLASVLMDRATGLVGVLLIGLVALLAITSDLLPPWNRWLIGGLLIAIPVALGVFYSRPVERLLERLDRQLEHLRVLQLGVHTLQRLQAYRAAFPRLTLALALTLALQSLVVVCYGLLGQALGAEVGWLTYFVVIPVLFIAVSLPISVGGLGVREGVFVTLMGGLGMPQQQAIGISVLYLGVILVLTLPGGLVLLARRGAAAQETSRESAT